jgi:hypothetical protein
MCVACATIPVVMALGASANARQSRTRLEAAERGEAYPKPVIPAIPATTSAVVVLMVLSAVIHSRYYG